jgi:hypothetical protein
MPKSDTVDEFAALMLEIGAGPVVADAVVNDPAPALNLEPAVPVVNAPVVVAPQPKPDADADRFKPVAKTYLDDDACPFQGSVAVGKGYLNMVFSRKQRYYLYDKQLEALIRWASTHGQDYLAKARAAGLK